MKQCPVCASVNVETEINEIESVYSSIPNCILRCSKCTHAFTGIAPTSEELSEIYAKTYSYGAHAIIECEKKWRAQKFADLVWNFASGDKPKILEIGCMHGFLLRRLQAKGALVTGVEIDAEAVEVCKRNNLNVVQKSLETYLQESPEVFDMIVMSHVFEHIRDLKSTLVELSKRLSAQGCLILILPNSHAFTARLFARYWGYWQVPVHFNHFNTQSLSALLKVNHFKVLQCLYRGADSLFFLATIANVFGQKSKSAAITSLQKLVIRTASVILWPWFFFGNEDLIVVSRPVGKA